MAGRADPQSAGRAQAPTRTTVRDADGQRVDVLSPNAVAAANALSPLAERQGIATQVRNGKVTVSQLAAEHGHRAVTVLAEIMNDASAPLSERRLSAVALLDRAYGRPAQAVDVDVRKTDMTALHLEALKRLSTPPDDVRGYTIGVHDAANPLKDKG